MLRLRLLLTLIIAGVLTLPLQAATITVADKEAAYTSIQAAINAADNGDEIIVSPGTYLENINFNGKAIILRSASGDPADTIIDGGGNGTVVTCESGETPMTVLDGFTITNGLTVNGGGMRNDESSPTVSNCTFSANAADDGGGMRNTNSNPTVTNCTFSDNKAEYGGGMYNSDSSSPTVTNCTFSGNKGYCRGGGMINGNSSPTVTNSTFSSNNTDVFGGGIYNYNSNNTIVTNCTFNGNTAGAGGAGIYNFDSSPAVTNCTFSGNTSDLNGGGMVNLRNSNPIVSNCTFSRNDAFYAGGILNVDSSPMVINCILWGNSPGEIENSLLSTSAISYSNLQGGLPENTVDGGGNIDVDPLFVNADGPDNTAGTDDDNLRLLDGSPSIDSGFFLSIPVDLDGNIRPVDDPTTVDTGVGFSVVVDMGAYEFGSSPALCISQLEGDINCDGIVNLLDLSLLALHWLETN